MRTYKNVHFTLKEFPESERLLDLQSIHGDLMQCLECIEALQKAEPRKLGSIILEALILTAFIRYGRCFASGVRNSAANELRNLMAGRSDHEKALNLRNCVYAHSVSDYENHTAQVILKPEGDEQGIHAITTVSTYAIREPGQLESLFALATDAIVWVDGEIRKERTKLQLILEKRYSVEEMYQLPAGQAAPVATQPPWKSRKPKI